MSDKIKIELSVHTGFVGGTHAKIIEIDKDSWDEMDEYEQEEYMDVAAEEFMNTKISWNAEVIE